MKVIFLKDVFDSPACRSYRKGEVHDITKEQYELFRGRNDDHPKALDMGQPAEEPVQEPAEEPKPRRGRPPKDEAPQE